VAGAFNWCCTLVMARDSCEMAVVYLQIVDEITIMLQPKWKQKGSSGLTLRA
jgi:predicted ATP-binding protein involved in virulence